MAMVSEELPFLLEQLTSPAVTLVTVQKVSADRNRELSQAAYGHLTNAHYLLTGTMGGLLLSVNEKINEYNQQAEEIDALCANFVIGMAVCEDSIASGAYLQAFNLLRQEMELLAQIKAVQTGKRNPKTAPNVSSLEETVRRLYGNLSEAAHISSHDVARVGTTMDLSGDEAFPPGTSGTRYFPAFDETMCRRSFGFHLVLMHHIIHEMAVNFTARFGENPLTDIQVRAINLALTLMMEEEIIEDPAA